MTSSFFEPSMNVLLFLMVKKFVYLEVLLILAGIKATLRTGAARYLSFVVIGICAAGIAAHFVVPYFQIYQQPWAGIAQFLIRTWDGMFTPLLASFVFLNTMTQKHGRLMVIDAVHMVLIVGLLGLWGSSL
jgi:ABC-type amino acid transport system permease subunit